MRRSHLFPVVLAVAAGLGITPSLRQAGTGTIAGHVTLTTRIPGAPLPSNAYPTRRVAPRAAAVPEIRNVIVYLKDPGFRGPLPVMTAELAQEDEGFTPHVLAITRGSSVRFPNDDPFFHNVFSLSSASIFDLGRYPQGQAKVRTFNKAGLVKVYCHIHSHMSATIMVLDHPYFEIPEVDGSFELKNVPAGHYTIVGWHERVGERKVLVRVEAGRTSTVEMSLPVEDPQ